MNFDFHPGQDVLCIDDSGTNLVRKGETYRVEEIHRAHYLQLAGVRGKGENHGMSKYRFSAADETVCSQVH